MSVNKLLWVTASQAIGCILVIGGHSYPFGVELPDSLLWGKQFLYSFHMAFFVIISGFLCGYSKGYNKYGVNAYLKNRAAKLLVPYFVISLIGLFPKIVAASYINDAMPEQISIYFFIRTLLVPRDGIWGHFWFLPMLFFIQIIALSFIRLYDKNKIAYSLSLGILLGLTYLSSYMTGWFSVSDICAFLFWYMFGFTISQMNFKQWKFSMFYSFLGLLFAIVLFNYKLGGIEKPLIVIGMTVFLIGCCKKNPLENTRLFKSMVGKTYAIYILSWPAQAVVEIITNKFLHWNVLVCMFSMFIAGIVIPLLIIQIVKFIEKYLKTNKLSLIIGA